MRHATGWIWKRWFGRKRGGLSKEWTRRCVWIGAIRITLDMRVKDGYVPVAVKREGSAEREVWSVIAFKAARRRKVKKKIALSPAEVKRHLAPMETEVLREFMPIIEHLAITQYDDKDVRQVGRMTLQTKGSVWQVILKDPDSCQEMVVNGQTLDEVLALTARLVSSEEAPWQPDVWAMQQKKKSKK